MLTNDQLNQWDREHFLHPPRITGSTRAAKAPRGS